MNRRFIIKSQTYDEIISEIEQITSSILPQWNIQDPNDIGRYLVEIGTSETEVNNVFANDLALEARSILDARDPKSVAMHAINGYYRVKTKQPSVVIIKMELKYDAQLYSSSGIFFPSNISINPYEIRLGVKDNSSQVKSFENSDSILISNLPSDYSTTYLDNSGVVYQVDETSIISVPGCYKYTTNTGAIVIFYIADFIEGESKSITLYHDGKDFSPVTIPDLDLIINEDPGILNDYGVHLNILSTDYSLVDTFLFSNSIDKVFSLRPNKSGYWMLYLADNKVGYRPLFNTAMTISYRIGGGNIIINANAITTQSIIPSGLQPYINRVYNQSSNYGGSDIEDIDLLKRTVPLLGGRYGTLDSKPKIKFVVDNIGGVARSRVTNLGILMIVNIIPIGGGVPSSTFLTSISDIIEPRLPGGYGLLVQSPVYLGLNVVINAYAKSNGLISGTVQYNNYTNSIVYDLTSLISSRLNPLSKDSNGNFINDFADVFNGSFIGDAIKNYGNIYDYDGTINGININDSTCTFALGTNQIVDNGLSNILVNVIVNQ